MELKESLRKKLFKLSAMNDLVEESPFLQGKYNKLSINAEEKFGYHWNEVIKNVLFNKYVQTNAKLKDKYMKIKNAIDNKNLEEMSTGGGGSTGDGSLTGNNSGQYSSPSAWSSNDKNRRFFNKKGVVKGLTPDNNMDMMKNESISAITDPSVMDDMYEELMSSFNVLDGIGKDNDDIEDDESNELTPKEIKSLFIMNCTPNFSKEDLDSMNESEVDGIYDSVYKETFPQVTNTTVSHNSTIGEKINKMKEKQNNMVNEEVKSNGMVQTDRIKKQNEINSKEHYKTLNAGTQKVIKNGLEPYEKNEPHFEYKYDKDSVEPVKYEYADERNKEYLEMVHRGMEDLKLDIPDKNYDDRLKKAIGDKAMKLVKKKQDIIQKDDYKNLQKGKMEIVAQTVKESFMQGVVLDKFGRSEIKSVALSKIIESSEIPQGLQLFETKGLGNAYEPILKEEIEKFDFFYSKDEDKVYKTTKKTTNVDKLDESVMSKYKTLLNYKPSKMVKNTIDRSKF